MFVRYHETSNAVTQGHRNQYRVLHVEPVATNQESYETEQSRERERCCSPYNRLFLHRLKAVRIVLRCCS